MRGVIINGRVIILDNSESVGIMDVASLSPAEQYLSNSGFPNRHIDIVASIIGCHFVALYLTHLHCAISVLSVVSHVGIIVVSPESAKLLITKI